jgi:sugar lactone lactonase YvrE
MLKADLLLVTNSLLGEGAIWNQEGQRLYWVDIELKRLHCFDPIGLEHESTSFQKKITTIVPTTKGDLLIGMEDGIYKYKRSIDELTLVRSNPENSTTGNRFNDGKCDPSGRFWIGTMGDDESAALYRLDADYQLHTILTGITNSNGILWSPDKLTMYYIDTPTYEVKAFDFDNNTGQTSNPRVIINIPASMGYPDGATIDSEGMIWIAIWGGYCVSRWNPKTGELLSTIAVPSKNVTSCTFGGANLDTLYITSARDQLSESELLQYPNSGSLFKAQPGSTGIKTNLFADIS